VTGAGGRPWAVPLVTTLLQGTGVLLDSIRHPCPNLSLPMSLKNNYHSDVDLNFTHNFSQKCKIYSGNNTGNQNNKIFIWWLMITQEAQ